MTSRRPTFSPLCNKRDRTDELAHDFGSSLRSSPAANLERTQSGNGLGFGNFYVIDSRGARAFAQTLVQACQLLARALRQYLDGAVRIVADPACDLQDVGFALDKPAKTDALDAAANQEAASDKDRVIG
jgi:hypothetical protein